MSGFFRESSINKSAAAGILLVAILGLGAGQVGAQTDTVHVKGDYPENPGNLNRAISAALAAGRLSQTVFKLDLNTRYYVRGVISVPPGEKLTLVAPEPGKTQETAPPQVLWVDVGLTWDHKFFIASYGDVAMRNVWVYFGDTAGVQVRTPIMFAAGGTESFGDVPQYGTFENCIFDFMPCPVDASGVICLRTKHFHGTFRNCYFRNCADPDLTYYGRAVSFPYDETGYHTDSILFENCTFANIGYVYQQESGNYADEVYFNHCSFLNVVMFSLESGWWYKLAVANSLWVNGFMRGVEPLGYSGYGWNPGGTINIDSVASFGIGVPFTDQDRRILFAHSSYFVEPWLVDWMANSPYAQLRRQEGSEELVPRPAPMLNSRTRGFFASDDFPYMNAANLYDGINPGMILPPTDTTAIQQFLEEKWSGCRSSFWAWRPELSTNYAWPLPENLAYTNDTLLSAGMGGFPLGDLFRWFPEEYARWKGQADKEWTDIAFWMETGTPPGGAHHVEGPNGKGVPMGFSLEQNYPNPCRATTAIRYVLPRESEVRLVVFDLLGRQVATVVKGTEGRGEHAVTFDFSNLPEGIYLYQVRADGVVKTRKLLVLR
ncbi:MAG: T9SS type A sorting domain-containing protein [candidate division KSB1 bacterium]|nr:T9SS type A sorting domain-containing protein [candidate division KSB1 bacterium]